jgi:hypothetical protein
MNLDYRVGLIVILTALCVIIPKSVLLMPSDRFCQLVEESSYLPTYYSQNFAVETQLN